MDIHAFLSLFTILPNEASFSSKTCFRQIVPSTANNIELFQ